MANTSSVYVDTTVINNALKTFNNLDEELDTIKKLSDISGVLLIPKDFYDGCNISNYSLGEEANGVFENYKETINKIKEYIANLDKVNELGKVMSDGVSALGMSGVGTASTSVVNSVLNKINNKHSNVGGGGNSSSNEVINNVVEEINSIDNTSLIDEEESINNIDEKTNIVDSNDTNTSDEIINIVDDSSSEVAGITEVNGNSVVEEILDANGNLVAVGVIGANGNKIWYQVVDGNKVLGENNTFGSNYHLSNTINIIDNGQIVEIQDGDYEIEQIIYNIDGSVGAIKIKCDNYKLLLYLDGNGNIIKVEYIKPQTGVFTINNTNYDIYDMYGNNLGKFGNGQYYIYETKYDQSGKIIGFRVSPDDEYEKWLYVNESTKESEYSLVTSMQVNDKTNVSLFDKNKGILGLLGLLFVGVGATIVMKKRMNKKTINEEYSDEEYYSYDDKEDVEELYYDNLQDKANEENLYYDNAVGEWEEEKLTNGNYPIYDVKHDESGKVTEARISPIDSEYEYWVEV